MIKKLMCVLNDFEKKIKWKKVVSCIVFLVIIVYLYSRITYIFRNAYPDRRTITGIKAEENLDVVCIGASSTLVYWEPFNAWNDYGFTSYNYAVNSARVDLFQGCIEEVLKTHSPELFIIDARGFAYWDPSFQEGGLRNITDSFDLSWNRIKTVYSYLSNLEDSNDVDVLSCYFDIAKYHSNQDVLGSEINWKYYNNDLTSDYKGWDFMVDHAIMKVPVNVITEERLELDESAENILYNLLELCKKKEINAVFVATPLIGTMEGQMRFNTVGDIVSSYGYTFLNTNNYYNEMGIDFEKDFYNGYHVNCYGAEKYTDFVARYIVSNYNIPDHRDDESYIDWNDYYEKCAVKESETKEKIDLLIESKKSAYESGLHMREIDNVFEWCNAAQNENYTVFIAVKGDILKFDYISSRFFYEWNLTLNSGNDNIRIYSGTNCIYWGDMCSESFSGTVGTDAVQYSVTAGEDVSIIIGENEYALQKNGVNIVVFDNNYNCVLDSVNIFVQNEDGELALSR